MRKKLMSPGDHANRRQFLSAVAKGGGAFLLSSQLTRASNLFSAPRSAQKPTGAYSVNFGHPLATGLTSLLLFTDDAASVSGSVAKLWNGARNTMAARHNDSATSPASVSSDYGAGLKLVAQNDWITVHENSAQLVATDRATILVIRRKTDTTLRASALFSAGSGAFGFLPARLGSHCPYSDGHVYWDFGGNSGSNRLNISGQSWNTNVDRLAFRAGGKGLAVWRNGIKIGSSSTAVTRSSTTEQFWINAGNGLGTPSNNAGDLQELYFFATFNEEWDDSMIAWWMAEPFAMLTPPARYFFGPGGPARRRVKFTIT